LISLYLKDNTMNKINNRKELVGVLDLMPGLVQRAKRATLKPSAPFAALERRTSLEEIRRLANQALRILRKAEG
jgi:hypothetical protein